MACILHPELPIPLPLLLSPPDLRSHATQALLSTRTFLPYQDSLSEMGVKPAAISLRAASSTAWKGVQA